MAFDKEYYEEKRRREEEQRDRRIDAAMKQSRWLLLEVAFLIIDDRYKEKELPDGTIVFELDTKIIDERHIFCMAALRDIRLLELDAERVNGAINDSWLIFQGWGWRKAHDDWFFDEDEGKAVDWLVKRHDILVWAQGNGYTIPEYLQKRFSKSRAAEGVSRQETQRGKVHGSRRRKEAILDHMKKNVGQRCRGKELAAMIEDKGLPLPPAENFDGRNSAISKDIQMLRDEGWDIPKGEYILRSKRKRAKRERKEHST